MKSSQENKLSMYFAVQKVCKANSSVWSGLPAFVTAVANFETNIGSIKDTLEAQGKNIFGVSQDKSFIKDTMIDKTLQVANAVFAYATEINDLTLRGKVDFSRSELKKTRDSFTLQNCQLVRDEANAIIGVLAPYGIVALDLTDLQNKIGAYASILAGPRTAITERKGATAEITNLFRKTDVILKGKMDKLMEKFKISTPKFYKLYFDSRIIVDLGTRHDDFPPPSPPIPSPI